MGRLLRHAAAANTVFCTSKVIVFFLGQNFSRVNRYKMKPYSATGKTPKKAGKKAKAVAGNVKKSMVKAKTNVVKASRKKLNQAAKEEVDDLLEKTATNGVHDSLTMTPTASQKAVAKSKIKKQL